MEYVNINILEGKILKDIKVNNFKDEILFIDGNDIKYKMFHDQNCCESVFIEDICGDINNLIGSPIVMAEEVVNYNEGPMCEDDESYTWTFYKLATVKGYVTIRWYGCSNGYYGEEVDFIIDR